VLAPAAVAAGASGGELFVATVTSVALGIGASTILVRLPFEPTARAPAAAS